MTSKVNIINCKPTPNKLSAQDKWSVEVSIEVLDDAVKELTWSLIYVGSPKDKMYDQQLCKASIGPLTQDKFDFVIEGNPPNNTLVPPDEVLGMSILFLIGAFHEQEFIRIGFYVSTFYSDIELNECPPEELLYEKLQRQILLNTPRITKFAIDWAMTDENSMVDMQAVNQIDFGDDSFETVPF